MIAIIKTPPNSERGTFLLMNSSSACSGIFILADNQIYTLPNMNTNLHHQIIQKVEPFIFLLRDAHE